MFDVRRTNIYSKESSDQPSDLTDGLVTRHTLGIIKKTGFWSCNIHFINNLKPMTNLLLLLRSKVCESLQFHKNLT